MKIALVLALAFCASALHLRMEARTITAPTFAEEVEAWLDISEEEVWEILADKDKAKAKAHRLFEILDVGKSGQVYPSEMKAFFHIFMEGLEAEVQAMAAERFKALDSDDSGSLSEAEFDEFVKEIFTAAEDFVAQQSVA